MDRLKRHVLIFLRQESAPTFLEYALLIIVIAMVVVVSAVSFGTAIAGWFSNAANYVPPN